MGICSGTDLDGRRFLRRSGVVVTLAGVLVPCREIGNTDDHLRNHGFLRLSTAGWSLSPAFDMNPDQADVAREIAGTSAGDS